MIQIGQKVDTPCRGYGVVLRVGVTVPYVGGGLVAVLHPVDGVLYYRPEELTPIR